MVRWRGVRPRSAGGGSYGRKIGRGYTYAAPAVGRLIRDLLADTVLRIDAMAVLAAWRAMTRAVRNLGQPCLSAIDHRR